MVPVTAPVHPEMRDLWWTASAVLFNCATATWVAGYLLLQQQ
jgi:hypothetical protein